MALNADARAVRAGRSFARKCKGLPMTDNEHQRASALDRRTLLRAGLAAAFAGPAGVNGAHAFTPRAMAPEIDFSQFSLCKTSSDAPPLSGAPRKLKMSWNAGAVWLAPVPVAIDHGFFD